MSQREVGGGSKEEGRGLLLLLGGSEGIISFSLSFSRKCVGPRETAVLQIWRVFKDFSQRGCGSRCPHRHSSHAIPSLLLITSIDVFDASLLVYILY